jgi:DUF971 family protein
VSTAKDPRFKAVAVRSPRGTRVTEIDWGDGHKGVYPHAVLRGYCPCAGCQGHSGTISFVETSGDQQELEDITPAGGYALALKWFDGHASGIYSYRYLRSLCRCAECAPPEGDAHAPLPKP